MNFPEFYEFCFPVKIISGHTALDKLSTELRQAGVCRPMIITDQGVTKVGLLEVLLNSLAESEIVIGAVYDQTPPESSTTVVTEIARIFREKTCDSLIAIGGGSVIDTTKGVNILVSNNSEDIRLFQGADILKGCFVPFYVVPTTAGTGSEATSAAVIQDLEKGVKMSLVSELLLPRAAILDTRMTLTLPPKLTAATGMDALTHAMEAYIGIQQNPMSDAFALQAITLIGRYLREVTANPKDKNGRLALANASTMAGTAFSNAMVGCVHSMGHATGAVAHVPHGVVMNVFLPHGLRLNLPKTAERIGEMLLPLAGAEVFASTDPEQRAEKTIAEVERLKEDLFQLSGLPRNLKEAGVQREQFDKIAALGINDGSALMNPVELTLERAYGLLEAAWEG